MDLLSFVIFVEIIDSGNLSRAARAQGISRANVSYHLGQLEKALGATLLRRTPQGIEATELGQQVYLHARNIVRESALAREAAQRSTGEMSGRIGLSAPTGYGQIVMAPWLIEFKRRYPRVVLDIRLENFIDDLVRDGVDIAVRVMSEPPPMLVARDLGAVKYYLCASPEWAREHRLPESPTDLQRTPLITSGGETGKVRLALEKNKQVEEIEVSPTLMSRNYPFVCDCVLAGLAAGLMPDYVARQYVEDGRLVLGMKDWELTIDRSHMYLLYMPNRFQSTAAKVFIDFLTDNMGLSRAIRHSTAGSLPSE
ncbi:LysR family transcriptional regulator [Cupriavidus oxalaticus]|uniref:LysR family transcriptional regulator n=1 Tax=Cupriavidus oxalaticus TaxID=96344 RepID=A0A5P3VJH3_9BURK|nr:LysR family transcriptional regulator [Cupriavidus oxalaticus]QEZ46576.1 LysR family transcriptional regulator [Cupriavidus oxalaticus]